MVRFDTFGTFWESIVFYASEMMHLPLCVPVLLAAAGDGSAAAARLCCLVHCVSRIFFSLFTFRRC